MYNFVSWEDVNPIFRPMKWSCPSLPWWLSGLIGITYRSMGDCKTTVLPKNPHLHGWRLMKAVSQNAPPRCAGRCTGIAFSLPLSMAFITSGRGLVKTALSFLRFICLVRFLSLSRKRCFNEWAPQQVISYWSKAQWQNHTGKWVYHKARQRPGKLT